MFTKSKNYLSWLSWFVSVGIAGASLLFGNQRGFVGEQAAIPQIAQTETSEDPEQRREGESAAESSRRTQAQPRAATRPRPPASATSSRNQPSRSTAQQPRSATSRRPSTSPTRRRPPGATPSNRAAPRRKPTRPPAEPVTKYTEPELRALASDIDRLSNQLEALNRRTTDRLHDVTPNEIVPLEQRFRFDGDYRRMLQLQHQLVDNPDDFEILLSLGTLLQRNHKFHQAEIYLLEALALQPLNQGLLSTLADLYLAKGEYPKAWEAFQEIIYLNPDNVDAYAAQGHIRELEGNFAGAEAIYRQIAEKHGSVAQVYAHRTINLAYQGKYGEAIALARDGITLYPDHASLYYARGQAYRGLGLVDQARTDYYDALALDPDLIAAYTAVGELALREENAVTAIKAYLWILNMRPGDPEASLGLGKGYLMDLRFPEAVTELEMLRYLHPEYHPVYDWLAQAYYLRALQLQEQGYSNQALDLHRMAISLAGNASTELVVSSLLLAGKGALSHNDNSLAVKYFELVLDNDPFSLEGFLGLGYAFKALGELTRARGIFQQALIIDPNHPEAQLGFDQLSQP